MSAGRYGGKELEPHDPAEQCLRKLEHRFGIGPKVGVYASGPGGKKWIDVLCRASWLPVSADTGPAV